MQLGLENMNGKPTDHPRIRMAWIIYRVENVLFLVRFFFFD